MDESFFAAQRRHRRTARLYTALAGVGAFAQGIPPAVILSPLSLAAAVLTLDLVNLVFPVPDLTVQIADTLERATASEREAGFSGESPPTVLYELPEAAPVPLLLIGVLPGAIGMVVLWWLIRRFMLRDGLGGLLITAGARPANRHDAEEHQLTNIVAEMALAAGIATPKVLVLPASVPNAAAFGPSPDRATIAVSRGVLDDLDRRATQGIVGHLVGSVANGDLRMRHSLLALFVTFALAADIVGAPFSSSCRARVRQAARLFRGRAGPEAEAATIGKLLAYDDSDDMVAGLLMITWKLAQFYLNVFVVGGLLTLPFRARRYLADATAVQLTRDPDGLGRALVHLDVHGKHLPGAEFADIYTIVSSHLAVGDKSFEDVAELPASLNPPIRRRVKRLARLGYRGEPARPPLRPTSPVEQWRPWIRWPVTVLAWATLGPLLAVLLVLLALVLTAGIMISITLGMGFFAAVAFIVAAPLHALLRGLA